MLRCDATRALVRRGPSRTSEINSRKKIFAVFGKNETRPEEDFRQMLQKKLDTNTVLAECSVDKKVCIQAKEIYKVSITKLEERLKRNNSWFDRNRGTLGVVTGLVIGTGLSVGIVHAVYQLCPVGMQEPRVL
jgi:hypothetical protein